jgi:hypothetical protein
MLNIKTIRAISITILVVLLSACGNRHYNTKEISRTNKTEIKKGYHRSLQEIKFTKGESDGPQIKLYATDIFRRPYDEYSYQNVKSQTTMIREPNLFMIVVGIPTLVCFIAPDDCFGDYDTYSPQYKEENRRKTNTTYKTETEPAKESQIFQLIIDNKSAIETTLLTPENGIYNINLQTYLKDVTQRPQTIMVRPLHQKSDKAFLYQVDNHHLSTFTTETWVKNKQKALYQNNDSVSWNNFIREVELLTDTQEQTHYVIDSLLALDNLSAAAQIALEAQPPYTANSRSSLHKVYRQLMNKSQYSFASEIATKLWQDNNNSQSTKMLFDALVAEKKLDKAEAILADKDVSLKRQLAILRDASLPKSIRKDKYLKILARELGNKNWQEALYYCQLLRKLAIKLPAPIDYFQGETLYHLGKKQDAQTYLLRYLNLGSDARYYNKSIDLLNQISGI